MHYSELKAEWEAKGLRGPSLLRPDIRHPVSAPQFLAELGFLTRLTGDRRFEDAVDAVAELGLIDEDCNWHRDPVTKMPPPPLENLKDIIFFKTQSSIEKGKTLRLACAEAAVKLGMFGHSFEAACKEIERLWRGYIKAGETKLSVGYRILDRVEANWPDLHKRLTRERD